jgi:hypothetical protein
MGKVRDVAKKSETRRYIDRSRRLGLARQNADASQEVFDDALDTYRKRELDLTAAWARVESAQTRLRLDREYLAKIGKEPR